MIVTGATMQNLEDAASEVGLKIDRFSRILNKKGDRIQFRLNLNQGFYANMKKSSFRYFYERKSASYFRPERRVHAVCWHGHRDFLDALFNIKPNAVVRSRIGREKVVHRGVVDLETQFIPIGAPIAGGYPLVGEACFCNENFR